MKFTIQVIFLSFVLLTSVKLRAEPGDYSAWQTFLNLLNPPAADNPVTAAQQTGDYPLTLNPAGFNDGFSPGNYLAWQTIQLDASTGAMCGNGSPYKFFVNRVANTSNTIIYLEGGGACWDYESCTGQTGVRGARNPDGIPDDYMSLQNPGSSLVSPFVFRLHPWTNVKTQDWNMIYVPYCTGDIYSGDKTAIYEDPSGQNSPLVWHHNGLKNMRAVIGWLKNNLQKPTQVLYTGCSAGGTGTLTNYAASRDDMDAQYNYMINDSGPVYYAKQGDNGNKFPSAPLHDTIREVWGLDEGPLDYMESRLPGLNQANLGTINDALSSNFVSDRLGHTHFWQDLNFSSYSYERFYDDIQNDPNQASKEQKIHDKWHEDTNKLKRKLSRKSNYGYYFPYFRNVNESHCTTIIEFNNADIQELGLELGDWVSNVMNGSGKVMEASETNTVIDYAKPFNLLYWTLDQLL
ncbi:MAG: hypothetical protein HWE16_05350 [Gammaproteobacteria bacterium]|nr:hypothetical protein [Gammaproteobacteria bacterium]